MDSEFSFTGAVERRGTGSLKWQKYAGKDILPMWVADMDFPSAPCIEEALAERVRHGVYGYTVPYPSVEAVVLEYLERVHGIAAKPEWLVWMPGLVPALNTASRAFEKPGDSVMTNTPVYPPFLTAPEWQDKELLAVPLAIDGRRYGFDFEAMEAAVNERTRLFILCNPHNPVGRAWSKGELEGVVDFCRRHKLIIVSDEIHCDLILDETVPHHSILNIEPEWTVENSLTLMAPSKTYNVPGLGCSFILIPNARLRTRFQRASRGMITEVNCFGYAGCEAAYRQGEPWRQELLKQLRSNHTLVKAFVEERLPELVLYDLEATYLAWLDVRALGLDAPDVHFEAHGVGLSNGSYFGTPGFLRLNFGCPEAQLKCALERMEAACKALRP